MRRNVRIALVRAEKERCTRKERNRRSTTRSQCRLHGKDTANSHYELQAIEKEYAGSVTLIDVWATWCPPCRRAMTVIDSIKPGYIEKGVKFVYITGETSPEKNWNDMIPNIHGDHYRLTNAQWETLMREQGIPGIPVYKVINKDGSTAFSNFTMGGYPGNEVIKPILDEALKK